MIDDDVEARRQQWSNQAREVARFALHLDEPVQFLQLPQQHRPRCRLKVRQWLSDEIEPDTDDTRRSQLRELRRADTRIDHHDPAQPTRVGAECGQQQRVVGPQKARLHQHPMGNTVRGELLKQLGQRRVVVGHVTGTCHRGGSALENMSVCVHGDEV